ncbi:MAG: patatin-like phospholipase family protein [Deltaproteobacteria bacterium]|nr:patatin-like phospholipase family protein [Deltaproteobacteria bacterium]
MTDNLLIFAGAKAYAIIQEEGLQPGSVEVVAGAAGGPKWLVLCGLDRAIFSDWITDHPGPLFLVGSSIGAWRFAALALGNDAYEKLKDGYIHQAYTSRPSAQEVSRISLSILESFLDNDAAGSVLSHQFMRLNVLAVQCRSLFAKDRAARLVLGMLAAGVVNGLSRQALRLFFSRSLFYDGRDLPPFFTMDTLPTHRVPLHPGNLRQAVLASGSIPLIMSGVTDIPGSPDGIYRDGGLVDYHINIPFGSDRIVLFPHYIERITPGWFDKNLFWRKPDKANLDNLVLLCPSRSFVESLPYSKIPDRGDFRRFYKKDTERIRYWEMVARKSAVLGDEFRELLLGDRLAKRIRPISDLWE